MVIVISGHLDYSVSPSQVWLRTLGLGLDTNTAGPSLLAFSSEYLLYNNVKFCVREANFRFNFLRDAFR